MASLVACAKFDADSAPAARDAGEDVTTPSPSNDAAIADSAVTRAEVTLRTADCGHDDIVCEALCGTQHCTSCREIREGLRSAISSVYVIRNQAGRDVNVYCDMITAGGGWTLAARSEVTGAAGIGKNFGWHRSVGDVQDIGASPYSLDVMTTLVVPPTEILFGLRGPAFAWGVQVFHATLPSGFYALGDASADIRSSVTTVVGACESGSFQTYVGFVEKPDYFYFRDVPDANGAFGLFATGWHVNKRTKCEEGGGLDPSGDDSAPGMIFVR